MTRKNFTASTLAGTSILLAGLFSANAAIAKPHNTKTQNNVHKQTANSVERIYVPESQAYQKPGAPIRYSYSLPKTIEVGQAVTLDLRLSEPFQTGDLQVVCRVKGDVSLHAGSGVDIFSMSGNDAHEMKVSFTANSLGRHYIQVQATSTTEQFGFGTRNFSIPIQVGPPQPRKPHPGLTRTPSGQNIIIMQATEEIK